MSFEFKLIIAERKLELRAFRSSSGQIKVYKILLFSKKPANVSIIFFFHFPRHRFRIKGLHEKLIIT